MIDDSRPRNQHLRAMTRQSLGNDHSTISSAISDRKLHRPQAFHRDISVAASRATRGTARIAARSRTLRHPDGSEVCDLTFGKDPRTSVGSRRATLW
ncbi:MAG: hypothetical protein DMF97_19400 [Acidobacteria bacterium]|nr:MAG: hypothetical protein DMF97_19400 [Acidobacteriota bacterium]